MALDLAVNLGKIDSKLIECMKHDASKKDKIIEFFEIPSGQAHCKYDFDDWLAGLIENYLRFIH